MKKIKNKINNETSSAIADLFKIFGDTTRCKIVELLFSENKRVNDIADELSLGLSTVSHSLRVLRQAKIVKTRKDGKEVIYSLNDAHIYKIFQMAKEHVEE